MALKANPADILKASRKRTLEMAAKAGGPRVRAMLETAQASLEKRLRVAPGLKGKGAETFTQAQMRVALVQVRASLHDLKAGMKDELVEQGQFAAEQQTDNTLRYLTAAEAKYSGIVQPLPIKEATMLDRVARGTESTVLNRIASDPLHPGQPGVLDRYGDAVIERFEGVLQQRYVARTSWIDTRDALMEESSFLQGAPAYWCERVARVETMNANNAASFESIRVANDAFGDMCKILVATFDNRTAADSFACHGEIRRADEAFEMWQGFFQHPPARPNDREVVVPHRIAWPLLPTYAWKSDGEVASRWQAEGRKGSPPARPKMTTIPLERFGQR